MIIQVGATALIGAALKEVWVGAAVAGVMAIAAYRYSRIKKRQATGPEKSVGVGVRSSGPKAPASRDVHATSRSRIPESETSQSAAGSNESLGIRLKPVVPNARPTGIPAASIARMPMPAHAEEPSSVRVTGAAAPTFRIPSAPKGFGNGAWVSPGQSVNLAGITIRGGMVYVGTNLPTPFGTNDPCLIDPSKPVAHVGDYTERQMGYWPSYSQIAPEARRAYLNWLGGGRKDPEADVGYVFLFFYGLERRVIIDGAKDDSARGEWPEIAAELRRLLAIYGEKSGSFRMYASSLLDWVVLAEYPAKLYNNPVPSFQANFELPLYIRLALGQAAVDAAAVPVQLALAWARLEPNISLRTPAKRCAAEFEQLFAAKYAEAFGDGIVIPRNRTKLKFVYRPASAGFHGHGEFKLTFRDTPDVTALTAPTRKLHQVVEAATVPLESFSRAIAKNPEARSSLEVLLQLPVSLWPASAQKALQMLKTRIGDETIAMPFQELLTTLNAKTAFTKDKSVLLAHALRTVDVGIEPDVLAGARAPKPEDDVVLFSLLQSEAPSNANGAYLAAALTLQLASAVASTDGEFSNREIDHLGETVRSWAHLGANQTRRLHAHLKLLTRAPASLTTLKKKFEPLDLSIKETIAAFMATVAQSDGEVSPAEVKMLQKVYTALGVDSKKVFTDLHAVTAGTKATAVTTTAFEKSGFRLDPARIEALQKDTEKVSALLANIFTEAEEPAATAVITPAEAEKEIEPTEAHTGLLGLDEAHSAFARMLLSRPEWSRDELLDVAADLELMLDGALEQINEAAFDAYDVPFFEGDDPLTINTEILERANP